MADKTHIRINKHQKNQLENIKNVNNLPSIEKTLDFLLRNQREVEALENLVKRVNMITNL